MLRDHVIKAAKNTLVFSPDNRGFVEAVESVTSFLAGVPSSFALTFHIQAAPTAMGRSPSETTSNVLKEIYGWLGFLSFSNAYKARQLVADLISGLNEARFLTVVALSRSLLEQAALLHDQAQRIQPELAPLDELNRLSLQAVDLNTELRRRYAKTVVKPWSTLRRWATLGRFDWTPALRRDRDLFVNFANVPPERKAVNPLTLVDKLAFRGPMPEAAKPRFFYEMLSDFVHPNAGSNALVVDRADRRGPNLATYTLSANPKGDSDLAEVVINLISIPVRESLNLIQEDVQLLLMLLERHRERLVQLGLTIE